MSWSDAKKNAADRIVQLNLPPGRLDGCTVWLLTFESDSVCYAVTGWGLAWHKMVERAMYRALKKRGAIVNTTNVKLADVVEWKATREQNTTEATR